MQLIKFGGSAAVVHDLPRHASTQLRQIDTIYTNVARRPVRAAANALALRRLLSESKSNAIQITNRVSLPEIPAIHRLRIR